MEALLGPVIALAVGWIQKHLLVKVPNNLIPFVNVAVITAGGMLFQDLGIEEALKYGLTAAAGGTGIHQAIKIFLNSALKKYLKDGVKVPV